MLVAVIRRIVNADLWEAGWILVPHRRIRAGRGRGGLDLDDCRREFLWSGAGVFRSLSPCHWGY